MGGWNRITQPYVLVLYDCRMQLQFSCNLSYATGRISSCMCRMQLKTSSIRQLQNAKFLVVMLLGHGMKMLKKLSTHSRKSFQSSPFWKDLISARFSFYTLIGTLLVLVLFLDNLMRKAGNMLLPMHPEATRLRATTLHTRGSVLLLYGLSYISGPIFMAPSSFCIPTTGLSSGWWLMTSLLVN
jgi:hypothetical protein